MGAVDTAGHPLQPSSSPAVSTMSCYWIKMKEAKRVGLTQRKSVSLKSNSRADAIFSSLLHSPPSPVATGKQ